jgi:hypothetical protein
MEGQNGVYDAGSDFSSSQNPKCAWHYGYSETLGGPFVLLTDSGTIFGNSQLLGWRGNTGNNDQTPVVLKNDTSAIQTVSGLHLKPETLGMHPGPSGQYSIVRWTAPTAGVFDVDSVFEARDRNDAWAADVHVLVNGVSVFAQSFAGSLGATSNPYQSQIVLSTGDTIDFAVGWGVNNTHLGDTTALHATITAVPDPDR